jgi:transposase-like protein
MEKQRKCPRCGSEGRQSKYGTNRSGTARYRCNECGKTYTPEPATNTYTEEEKSAAIKTYYEGVSGRGVGRLHDMSKANVFRWIKERAAKLASPESKNAENTMEPVETIELDELFHYVKKRAE